MDSAGTDRFQLLPLEKETNDGRMRFGDINGDDGQSGHKHTVLFPREFRKPAIGAETEAPDDLLLPRIEINGVRRHCFEYIDELLFG
jgi:hypothetical protein